MCKLCGYLGIIHMVHGKESQPSLRHHIVLTRVDPELRKTGLAPRALSDTYVS